MHLSLLKLIYYNATSQERIYYDHPKKGYIPQKKREINIKTISFYMSKGVIKLKDKSHNIKRNLKFCNHKNIHTLIFQKFLQINKKKPSHPTDGQTIQRRKIYNGQGKHDQPYQYTRKQKLNNNTLQPGKKTNSKPENKHQ